MSDYWTFQNELDAADRELEEFIEAERDRDRISAENAVTMADVEMDMYLDAMRSGHRMRSGPARDRCLALVWKTGMRLRRGTWTWRDISAARAGGPL
jgi:hypothetical protein